MVLPDTHVLVYAHRVESAEHEQYASWLRRVASGPEPFALSELVASCFIRIVTHPGIWEDPTTTEDAVEFVERLRRRSNARFLTHGARSWAIFAQLCRESNAEGKLVADAYHAALAIEHGCELVTVDADFARFRGLRHRHPLAP